MTLPETTNNEQPKIVELAEVQDAVHDLYSTYCDLFTANAVGIQWETLSYQC